MHQIQVDQIGDAAANFAPLLIILMVAFGVVISLLITVFWLWMLIDCIKNEPDEGNTRVIWAVVIILLGGLGAIIYYFARRPDRIREVGR